MNRGFWILILLCLIAIMLMFLPREAGASVDSVDWVRSDGSICSAIITEYGVALDCDCPCFSNCEESEPQPTLMPTDEPRPKPTQKPKPTKKPKCNCGAGNGGEGCDPNPNCKKKKKPDEIPTADMPNPAAGYCLEMHYKYEIVTEADGGQYGICKHGNKVCDGWAFYNGECSLQ